MEQAGLQYSIKAKIADIQVTEIRTQKRSIKEGLTLTPVTAASQDLGEAVIQLGLPNLMLGWKEDANQVLGNLFDSEHTSPTSSRGSHTFHLLEPSPQEAAN